MVRDYTIIEDENNFIAQLEVPDFEFAFSATIFSFTPATGETVITFENPFGVSSDNFIGGKFNYPLLELPAVIKDARPKQEFVGALIKELIEVTIDQELLQTHDSFGAIVEVYNSTKIITDYIISKTEKTAICFNESELCIGEDTEIVYDANLPAYQSPVQMSCFETDSTNTVKIEIIPTVNSITLEELQYVSIDFFNGVESEAPTSVTFTVNSISVTKNISSARIVDGYTDGLYDPAYSNTGQILEFFALAEQFADGYESDFMNYVSIEFTGKDKYCMGEFKTIADTRLVNSICRVTLNEEELYLSSTLVSGNVFSKYQIHIDRGSLLVFFGGVQILTRPILFVSPTFEFGAAGKVLDDLVKADFRNVSVDQFFTSSPAKVQKIGRFIEIEGNVVN